MEFLNGAPPRILYSIRPYTFKILSNTVELKKKKNPFFNFLLENFFQKFVDGEKELTSTLNFVQQMLLINCNKCVLNSIYKVQLYITNLLILNCNLFEF